MPHDHYWVKASIDFGTHASGFGWYVHTGTDDDPAGRRICTFDQWPGQPVASVKTLTALLLGPDGEVIAWGHEAARLWSTHRADQRDRGWRYFHGFKMSLARDEDSEPDAPHSMALHHREDRVEELITKYLRCIYQMALQEITISGYDADDIRWCLTVPAIWTEHQKAIMRHCAHRAGFPAEDGRLLLALEPEAAAQHARVAGVKLTGQDDQTDTTVLNTPGRRFTVADCGGGTVDMTSYQVESPTSMIELGSVSGDARGSKFVNLAFEQLILIPRLGGMNHYRKLQDSCPAGLEELLDAWERAKLNVTVDQHHPIYLPITLALARKVPARVRRALAAAQDGTDDSIVVTPTEIRTVFEAVVPQILTLVTDQIDEVARVAGPSEQPEVVLLVGGFAASAYLRQRLIDHLGDKAIVVVPPNPAVSVLAGAVHFACRPDTRARRSRRTYGVNISKEFVEGVDPEDKRLTPDGDKTDRCVDRFDIFVRKGDLVPSDAEISTEYIPLFGDQSKLQVEFFGTNDSDPRYVDEPTCELLGHVNVDLKEVMRLHLDQRTVQVSMRFGETEIKTRVVLVETGRELEHSLELLTA